MGMVQLQSGEVRQGEVDGFTISGSFMHKVAGICRHRFAVQLSADCRILQIVDVDAV